MRRLVFAALTLLPPAVAAGPPTATATPAPTTPTPAPAAPSPAPAVEQAQAAALAWLALTDAGRLGASWDAASSLFRGAVSKADWEAAVGAARSPLGAVLARTLKSATVARTLPGAPDGEYVVIEFDTRFEHKAAAVETVTPMREPDGAFRVSGYYIR